MIVLHNVSKSFVHYLNRGPSAGHIYPSDYGRLEVDFNFTESSMGTKENKIDFNIQAILSEMLHTPGICFSREQFLRAEFKRFYPQDIIDKIVISNPANVGVPPEVIDEIIKPIFEYSLFSECLFRFKYEFDIWQPNKRYDFDSCIFSSENEGHSFLCIDPPRSRWHEKAMLDFCRGSLFILQILIYIYGLQQIDINNDDTLNSEILNLFIVGILAMLEDTKTRQMYKEYAAIETFVSIIDILRKRELIINMLRNKDLHRQIIKEVTIYKISDGLSRRMTKRLERLLKKTFMCYCPEAPRSYYTLYRKDISDRLKLELYYPQYIQTLRENRSLI